MPLKADPMASHPPSQSECMRLKGGGALVFQDEGFRLIPTRGFKRSPLRPYESISNIFANERILMIGTTQSMMTIRASDFESPNDSSGEVTAGGVAAAQAALLARIARSPEGPRQLEDMSKVDRLGEQEGPTWIIWAVAALCLVGTGFQIFDPTVKPVGAFLPELFSRGEYWRAITAHFLHEITWTPAMLRPLLLGLPVIPIHLAVNVGGMFVLGHLVERPLGSWRTALVLAFSGVGTIVGIMFAGHLNVVGSSGLVAGLAGAMLALELHQARWLPVIWRIPRRVFIAVIVLQFVVLDQIFSNMLAGGAHLGGFAGGYAAAYLLGRPSVDAVIPSRSVRMGAYSTVALVLIGFTGAIPLARNEMPALERHALRLFNTQTSEYLYEYENAASWLIATEGGASDQGLGLAIALADRAVANTRRIDPGVLDTLAEALFRSGDRLGALLIIEEAIRLQPREPYYHEQRRRFIGERDAGDRPPPPGLMPLLDVGPDGQIELLPIDLDELRLTL
jgi:membrane associated rhomboid family serine protease